MRESEEVGHVPFLNGGLFEESTEQSSTELLRLAHVQVKNSTFKAIFEDLLEKFNFTVTEDTPLDVEVAIDPEMLGNIFESLILQLEKDPDKDLRKLTGSYYTPRPIVHFMCQEALKEYLVGELAGGNEDQTAAEQKLGELLSLPPAGHLDDEQIARLTQLFSPAEANRCDSRFSTAGCAIRPSAPACFPSACCTRWSERRGDWTRAFTAGRCSRGGITTTTSRSRSSNHASTASISKIRRFRLCELRLWLSLVVDLWMKPEKPFAQAIREVPSLPNLSYRIVRGDSLLERLFGHVVQLDEMAKDAKTKQLIDSIQADKQSYFREGARRRNGGWKSRSLRSRRTSRSGVSKRSCAAMTTYQTNLFGDEHMTVKERWGEGTA